MWSRYTRIVFVIYLLFSFSTADGQRIKDVISRDTLVRYYSLDAAQLKEIYSAKKIKDTAWYTQSLVKFYSYNIPSINDSIGFGSYLQTFVVENQVFYKLIQNLPFKLLTKKLDGEIIIYLKSAVDSTIDDIISDAKLTYLGHNLVYDSSFGAYILPKELLMTKEVNKFIQIEYRSKFYIQQLNYTPEYQQKYNSKYKEFSARAYGYCITDKPLYKLGDSLHFKSFLYESQTGLPLDKEVYLKIYDNYYNRNVVFIKLKPISPGAFVYDWQIPDTLRQDMDYTMTIGYGYSKSRFISREHKFRIESYILDKSNISFSPSRYSYKAGEPIELKATTTDANGFAIGDVRLQYIVKINDISLPRQDTFILSQKQLDSFIVVDTVLPYDKVHTFLIDYKRLPNADLRFTISGTLTDPQFEKIEFNYTINYSAEKDKFIFIQQEDSVIIQQLYLCKDVAKKYKLKLYNEQYELKDSLYIMTPYAMKLDPSVYRVALFDSFNFIDKINITYNTIDMLKVKGSKNPRDIQISFKYPFKNPVYYRVKQKDKIVLKGYGENLRFVANDSTLDEYSIVLSHNYDGEIEENTYRFTFYALDKKVNIYTTIPDKAFPGQTLPLEFQVTDWYGKPIPNFNLASYAVNNQFKDKISEPYIDIPAKYKLAMHIETLSGTYNNLQFSDLRFENSYTISPRHIPLFDLYKNEFYQILFPQKGYKIVTTKKHFAYPELTVSVSYKGKLYFPKYFMLDNQYTAVSNINSTSRYSFIAKEGFHSLQIRAFDRLIYIPKIEVKSFTKYNLSISLDSIEAKTIDPQIIVTDSLPIMTTTATEQKSLEKSFLFLNGIYIDSILKVKNTPILEKIHSYSYANFEQIRIDNDYFYVMGPFDLSNIVLTNKFREYTLQTGRFVHYFSNYLPTTKEIDKRSTINFNLQDQPVNQYQHLIYQVEKDTLVPIIFKQVSVSNIERNIEEPEYFDASEYAYNENRSTTNTFHIQLHQSTYNSISALWVVNAKDKYSSQFFNSINTRQTFQIHNANTAVDIYFISSKNRIRIFKNIIIKPNHILYVNGDLLKLDTLMESDLKAPIALYNKLTEIPKLPFYYNPEESRNIPLEVNSILNDAGKAVLTGIIQDGQYNAVADAHILLEQNGLFKYGATTNEKGEFEFLNIPSGIYDIKIYHADYAMKFFYHANLGGKFQQMLMTSLKSNENLQPRFESVANSHRLSIFDSKAQSKLQINIYDRETRAVLKNSSVKFYYDDDSLTHTSPHLKPIRYKNEFDSFKIISSCLGYKSISFRLTELNIEHEMKLDVFLDKNTALNSATDFYDLVVGVYEEEESIDDLVDLVGNLDRGKGAIVGSITDESGNPIPFAQLVIVEDNEGKILTKIGAKSNINGQFVIKNLDPKKYNVLCKSISYKSLLMTDITLYSDKISKVNFALIKSNNDLKAVIIRGRVPKAAKIINVFNPKESYGTREMVETKFESSNSPGLSSKPNTFTPSKSKSYSTTSKKEVMLMASTREVVQEDMGSGINMASERGDGVVYFIDGVKITGSPSIPAASMSGWSGNDETNLEPVNEKEDELEKAFKAGMDNKIRENFSDVGYWIPNLVTDKSGKAKTSIKLPDNITQWQSYTIGMGSLYSYGQTSQKISVYKPLQTITYTPTFLHEGDSIWLKSKFTNLTATDKEVKTFFEINKKRIKESLISIKNFTTDSVPFLANTDTIEFIGGLTYENKYRDAEKIKIPVLSNDIKLYNSQSVYAENDSIYTIEFKENTKGTISFNNSIYENILLYIEDLNNYSYGCVEQTASKLKALVYKQAILTKLNKPQNIQKEINQMAKRLDKLQNRNGSFGWWRDGDGDMQMTTYALDALMTYARGGYNSAGGDAANYLKKQFPKELQAQHLYSAYTLMKYNMIPWEKVFLNEIDVLKLNTTEKIYFYKIKQMKGEIIHSNDWYQLLLELGNNMNLKHYGNFFHDHKANLFNAYNLFKGTNIEGEMKAKFRQDIITGNLSKDLNTFSKAAMIQALVQDEYLENTINSQLIVNDQIKVNQYPHRMKIDMISKLKIQHTGAPIWMTTSEEEFVSNPTKHDSVFSINTQFIQNTQATNILTRGLPTQLRVDIYAFQSKDYVMIEIPLPAGVIIKDKKMYYGKDYIEYKSDKILIFKNKISIGENTLTFDIQPIYSGKFNIPPAQISMMYYPHIYGNNLKKEIEIR